MAENRRPNGPADKADEKGAKRSERCGEWFFVRKIKLAENQSSRNPVDKEVIPFDCGADRRGYDGFAQLFAVIGWRQRRLRSDPGQWGRLLARSSRVLAM